MDLHAKKVNGRSKSRGRDPLRSTSQGSTKKTTQRHRGKKGAQYGPRGQNKGPPDDNGRTHGPGVAPHFGIMARWVKVKRETEGKREIEKLAWSRKGC